MRGATSFVFVGGVFESSTSIDEVLGEDAAGRNASSSVGFGVMAFKASLKPSAEEDGGVLIIVCVVVLILKKSLNGRGWFGTHKSNAASFR